MPISPINSINNTPSFGAKLKIVNEGYELLCKYDKEVLQAAASKVGTKSDIIHVNIGKYEYGRTGSIQDTIPTEIQKRRKIPYP